MSLTKVSYSMVNGAPYNIKDFGAVGDGVADDTQAFVDAFDAMAQYSIPANPCYGGTEASPTGGALYIPDGTYRITSSVRVPQKVRVYNEKLNIKGNGECAFFGANIKNDVVGGPGFIVESDSSIEGLRIYFDYTTPQHAAIQIVAENVAIRYCTFEAHKTAIEFYNERQFVDPVFALIEHNHFAHADDPTSATITFRENANPALGTNAGSGSIIRYNNFNCGSAFGYSGVKAIDTSNKTTTISLFIYNNIVQGYADDAEACIDLRKCASSVFEDNSVSVATSLGRYCVSVDNISMRIAGNGFGGGSNGISIGANAENITLIGNDYSGGITTAVLLSSGAAFNTIIERQDGITITDSSGTANNLIYSDTDVKFGLYSIPWRYNTADTVLAGRSYAGKVNSADGWAFTGFGSGLGFAQGFQLSASTGTACLFLNESGVQVGGISLDAVSTTYATSSDYRLKENVAPMTGALEKVAQLNPVTYTWKADGSAGQGFIAHELQAVVPDAVTGEKDAVDEDGNPQYQGVDTSFLVATLTAAIQELKAEFDAYKTTHP